jgi:hypothetical protein
MVKRDAGMLMRMRLLVEWRSLRSRTLRNNGRKILAARAGKE